MRRVVRSLVLPTGVEVIGVGGATLGGSGKTRVAIAIARAAAAAGREVVVVGHAYRASPKRARIVRERDPLAEVGDEAKVVAEALAPFPHARVVVAPRRQAAIDFAAGLRPRPDVLVLDGVLQTAPRRVARSVLALDAEAPWGSGALPPAGDLVARPDDLTAVADVIVPVPSTLRLVRLSGETLPIEALAAAATPVALFTALARPDRVVEAVRGAGITPIAVVSAPDHGGTPRAVRERVLRASGPPNMVWLATAKCATHLEGLPVRVARIVCDLALPDLGRVGTGPCRDGAVGMGGRGWAGAVEGPRPLTLPSVRE